jgi:hypothetical protein
MKRIMTVWVPKGREILHQLSDYRLIKKNIIPWGEFALTVVDVPLSVPGQLPRLAHFISEVPFRVTILLDWLLVK